MTFFLNDKIKKTSERVRDSGTPKRDIYDKSTV